MNEKIATVLNEMSAYLSIAQMKKLQEVIVKTFSENELCRQNISNHEFLEMFLTAKQIEGCSERTTKYYRTTVNHLLNYLHEPIRKVTTETMRQYLVDYQKINNCGKTTIDNIRRNISSFFSWLEEEDYILKSPMRRIHKIKTKKTVKNIISDEEIERLRDSCDNIRDTAMVDLLYSTGIRVGELVRLNREDINFAERECVVFGKGDKERRVYFDAKAKIHLEEYLQSRTDSNPALFVTLDKPYDRLKISGVEIRLRQLGRRLKIEKIHPHKFRRTMATRAIDKGMPIEQVQKILGHSQIDTTMQYAIVNQNNVKASHRKYIAFRIDPQLNDREMLFAKVIRDADKIDILKVATDFPLEEIYNVATEQIHAHLITEEVIQQFRQKQAIFRDTKKVPIDNLAGHIALVFELEFPQSYEIVKEQGYLDRLLAFQSPNEGLMLQFQEMRQIMQEHLQAMAEKNRQTV